MARRRRRRTTREAQRPPVTEAPWFRPVVEATLLLLAYLVLAWLSPPTPLVMVVDLLGFVVVFFLSMALVSQFILPVTTGEERTQAFNRFAAYVSGRHGPIVFVRDGELIASESDIKREGLGVVLADAASGVVIEKTGKFSRAVGPGITFLASKESIKTTIDLRTQMRKVDVPALTRSGIEIKAGLTIIFALDTTSLGTGDLHTEELSPLLMTGHMKAAYRFDPESARRAAYGKVVSKDKILDWTELPAIVAVEAFRDRIARLDIDQIFVPFEEPRPSTTLGSLQRDITREVQANRLLTDRGVKVYNVSIGMLELPSAVDKQLLDTWKAHWQRDAKRTEYEGDVAAEQVMEKARAEAQREFVDGMNGILRNVYNGHGGDARQVNARVAQRLVEELNRAASDPLVRRMLPADVVRDMQPLREWSGLPPDDPATPPQQPATDPPPPTAPSAGPPPAAPDEPEAGP